MTEVEITKKYNRIIKMKDLLKFLEVPEDITSFSMKELDSYSSFSLILSNLLGEIAGKELKISWEKVTKVQE